MAEYVLGSASGLILSPITVSIIVSGSESRRYLSMYWFASTMSGAMKNTTASYPPVPKITFSVVHSSHLCGSFWSRCAAPSTLPDIFSNATKLGILYRSQTVFTQFLKIYMFWFTCDRDGYCCIDCRQNSDHQMAKTFDWCDAHCVVQKVMSQKIEIVFR